MNPYVSSFFLAVAGLIVAAVPGGRPAWAQEADTSGGRPPNLVLIMADDLGYGDLGSYGQTKIRTPHLDRMAREGTRFTQFYAGSTVCAPSRSVLMTGLHTGRTPVRGNRRGADLVGDAPLPDSTVTVAEVLQEAGYVTGAFGKWGLGGAGYAGRVLGEWGQGGPGSEGAPWNQGFDLFFGYLDQVRAHAYYPGFLFRNGERVPQDGAYSHDVIADSALAFVERHRDEPFFLYLPFTLPHAELAVPEDAYTPYLDSTGQSVFAETPFGGGAYPAQPRPRATYAAMVSRLDRDVGRLLETLEALGLAEDTIVLFTSDNGPHEAGGNDPDFFDSNGPFRGRKRDLYEGGIRVPMIAWGPGRVPAGRTSGHVWAMWDVLPTLADLAGADAPTDVDGLSMAALVTGRSEPPRHDVLYWEFHERGTAQAVRFGPWKAIRQPMRTGPVELYHLEKDPGERRDMAAERPDVVARAVALMAEARTPSPHWEPPSLEEGTRGRQRGRGAEE